MVDRFNPFNVDESDIVIMEDSEQVIEQIPQPVQPIVQPINSPTQQIPEPVSIEKPVEQKVEQPVIQEKTIVIQPAPEELYDEEEENVLVKPIEEVKQVFEEDKVDSIQQKIANEKGKQYLDIIQEYVDSEGSAIREQLPNRKEIVTNILEETYQRPKIPVYKYGKDIKTGNITIEPKNTTSKIEAPKAEESHDLKDNIARQEIKKMIEDANRNIIRTKIELRIHVELIINASPEQQKLYEIKIKSYKEDLEYYIKRKSILEKI